MENVAEHINDMMRVHEEFGDVFDSLVAEQYHVKQEVGIRSPSVKRIK